MELYEKTMLGLIVISVIIGISFFIYYFNLDEEIAKSWKAICGERGLAIQGELGLESSPWVTGFLGEMALAVTYIKTHRRRRDRVLMEVRLPGRFPSHLKIVSRSGSNSKAPPTGNAEFDKRVAVSGHYPDRLVEKFVEAKLDETILRFMEKYPEGVSLEDQRFKIVIPRLVAKKEEIDEILDEIMEVSTALLEAFGGDDELRQREIDEKLREKRVEAEAEVGSDVGW